jgi:hypothetical protein
MKKLKADPSILWQRSVVFMTSLQTVLKINVLKAARRTPHLTPPTGMVSNLGRATENCAIAHYKSLEYNR